MVGPNRLGTAITVTITLLLAALFLEIIYVLLRRHRLRRRPHSDPETHSQLLRFLCCKRKSRVEPQRTSPPASSSSPPELAEQVIKWQCLHGPSRVLFTIKEEDREGLDSENFSSAETVPRKKRVCYAAEPSGGDESVEEVEVIIETTPFSTPCASPPYFTPSSSPGREVGNGDGCLMIQAQVDRVLS